jgi:integration host factor subunit beta
MTRSELILRLADRFPTLQHSDAEQSVRIMLDEISLTLAEGERAEIRGFGSFTVNVRPARKGRNPRTGEAVLVPEKCVVHFKAGKDLRERVDEESPAN